MSVKRWWFWQEWDSAEMRESGAGNARDRKEEAEFPREYYVLASDYDRILSERDLLQQRLDALNSLTPLNPVVPAGELQYEPRR